MTTMPVLEEELDVDVREQSTGRVRISTRTETAEHLVEETLSSTTANVTRVPMDRVMEPGEPLPDIRTEAGVTIVPVLEERLFVEKRLVLVEEIRIERHEENEQVALPVSLRRQEVDIERLPESSRVPHSPTRTED